MPKPTFLGAAWFREIAPLVAARQLVDPSINMSIEIVVVDCPAGSARRSGMAVEDGRVFWRPEPSVDPIFRVTVDFQTLHDTWAGDGLAVAAAAYLKGLLLVEGDPEQFDTLIDVMNRVFSDANNGGQDIRELTA